MKTYVGKVFNKDGVCLTIIKVSNNYDEVRKAVDQENKMLKNGFYADLELTTVE